MLLRPLQPSSCQHGCFRRLVQQQYHISQRAVTARAMPFQLPNPAGPLLNRFNRPQPQQLPPVPPQQQPQLQLPQQQQQQTHNTAVDGPVQHSSAQVVPLSPAQQQPGAAFVSSTSASTSTSTSSASASLRFAKHLANASNGCAPPSSRFESTGWLLFETKRLQAALIGPAPHTAERWVASTEGLQLLEQVYLVGAAIAELGTADGLQPLSSSNGSRAIVSLDYSRLLERYLQQHGHLLAEEFWSGLHAFDDLQARAIHVATALETRCMVHALLFDKLIERVGTEGSSTTAWGANWAAPGSAPLATAITNTMINTTQQHSAPVTTQSTVAAPSAVNSNSGNTSNVSSSSSSGGTAAQPAVHGLWGWIGQLGAVFLLLCTVAGKVVHIVIAVVSFAKDVVLQLLMLRAVSAGAKAVAAKAQAGPQAQLRPAFAAAGAAASLPGAQPLQARQLPAAGTGSAMLQPAAAEVSAGGAAAGPGLTPGSLGLLGAVNVRQQQPHPAQPEQLQQRAAPLPQLAFQQQQQPELGTAAPVAPEQPPPQQQGQWRLEAAAAVQPTAAWAPAQPPATAAAGPGGSGSSSSSSSRQRGDAASPQQRLRRGLKGLGAAQLVLGKAAARAGAAAAALPSVLQGHQQQGQAGGFKAGSRHLLYSLWSPAEAGLQELEAEAAAAAAGVRFADAGWGVDHGGAVGAVTGSTEEGGW